MILARVNESSKSKSVFKKHKRKGECVQGERCRRKRKEERKKESRERERESVFVRGRLAFACNTLKNATFWGGRRRQGAGR